MMVTGCVYYAILYDRPVVSPSILDLYLNYLVLCLSHTLRDLRYYTGVTLYILCYFCMHTKSTQVTV